MRAYKAGRQHGTNRDALVSVAKTPGKARKARRLGGDTYALATLEGLPTGVLQAILCELPIFDYRAVNIVSKTGYNAMGSRQDIVADKKQPPRFRLILLSR